MVYDVIIIGGGVSGAASALFLSKYNASVLVLERGVDVCEGTSKANSAIVHAGFDAKPGTLMAKLNLEGSLMMEDLARDLDFPYLRNGALVVCIDNNDRPNLEKLLERGKTNGVEGLRIVERDELVELEPNVSDKAVAALYAPTSAIICPFLFNVAMAETAYSNGVKFWFNSEVKKITKTGDTFKVYTKTGIFESKTVVNAAGVYADDIHNMICPDPMKITARKGEYLLLDKPAFGFVRHTVFCLPTAMGKGVLVTPTIHGNVLLGPTAKDIEDKENTRTTREGLDQVREKCFTSMKNVPLNYVINSFAGLRAHEDRHEFIIRENEEVKGFVDCAGIESPGLTAAPAIGRMVSEIVRDILSLKEKSSYKWKRKGILNPRNLKEEEYKKLVKKDPSYGKIVCRCNNITLGEIQDAIRRPLGAKSFDGIKRRTTTAMGRCQASFCMPGIMDALSKELCIGLDEVTKNGGSSIFLDDEEDGSDES